MDSSELRELLTADGLRLLDSLPAWDAASDVVRSVATLRAAGHSPTLVAAVLSQARLRARAAAKFGPFAAGMLFTEAGLEQATRLVVAGLHARRFTSAGVTHVADLGSGIGGDSMAFAAADLRVTAVDRDEVTAAIASFNLAPFDGASVVQADVAAVDLTPFDGLWFDPARRTAGHTNTSRLADPADWSPSLDSVFELARSRPTGVKLGPGIDRDLVPDDAEAQWISVDREVVELGLWFGATARPGIRRAALVIGDHGSAELTAESDTVDEEVGELGEFVVEPDGAVIRARLIGDLARSLGGRMISPGIAYITTDAAPSTPFARGFRVIESLPFDEKVLKQALRARGIGRLEIKKRGVDTDPAMLRKRLALEGSATAVLIVTRVAGRHRALLAERV